MVSKEIFCIRIIIDFIDWFCNRQIQIHTNTHTHTNRMKNRDFFFIEYKHVTNYHLET